MTTNGPALVVPPTAPTAASKEFHAVQPPVEIPDYWIWLWCFLAVVVAAVAAYFLVKYWKSRQQMVSTVPVIPSHLRARRRLEEALRLIDDPKPFTIEVGDTIRQYLEERFDFHAPDRTTEEFLYELQGSDVLTPDQKQSLGEFLSQGDMVKFARYEPTIDELRAMHASAVRLISETEPTPISSEAPPTFAAS